MGPRPIYTTRDMDKTRDQLLKELQDLRDRLAGMRDGEEACSRLAAIVDSSYDAIIGKALDGTITSWNTSAERLYGYSEAEAVGRPIGIIVPPDRTRELEWILNKIKRGGRVEHHETVRVTKDGRRLDVSVTISPIFDPAGRIVGASTIARDITERKRAEEALRKAHDELEVAVEQRTASLRETQNYLESLLNYANAPIIVWNPEFTITQFNHAFERLSGYGAGEVVGKNLRTLFPPGSVKESLEKIRSTLAGERWESVEIPILRKDGSIRIALWNSANVSNEKGELLATIAQGQDITERKRAEEALLEKQEELKAQAEELEVQAEELRVNNEELERQIEERRRAEEALRESEEKFRILADFTYDWVIWSSPKGNYIYVSPSCERITGHKADEFYNDPGLLDRVVHPDDKKAFEQHMDSHLRNASLYGNFDFRIISTSGETRWINHVCQPIFRDNGEWLGRRASNRDITERKLAEAELIKKSDDLAALNGRLRLFSQAVEQSASVVVITDSTGSIQYVNPKFTELTGYSLEEAIGKNPRILKTGETPPEEYRRLWETITSGKAWHGVFHNKKKNGDLYWESAIISPIMDDSGKITNFMAVKEDITERKRMEDALLESERNLARAQAISHVGNWQIDSVTEVASGSDELYRILGVPRREAFSFSEFIELVHPDDRPMIRAYFEEAKRTHQKKRFDFRIVRPDGEERDIFLDGEFALDGEGRPRMLGTMQDITERKRTEKALRVSEERLRRASRAGRIGLYEWNVDRDLIYFSPEAYELYGLEPGSPVTYEEWLTRVHSDDRETFERRLAENRERARREPGFSTRIEYRMVHGDGAVHWLESTSTYALEGGCLMIRGAVRDITGRKQMEEELRRSRDELEVRVRERTKALCESESTLAWAQSIAHVGNFSLDVAKDRAQCSDEFYRILGLEPQDRFSYTQFLPYVHPEDREKIDRAIHEVWDQGKRRQAEFRIVRADGEVRFIYGDCSLIVDGKGRTMFGILQDITERKRAEEELTKSKRQAELYLDLMGHDITNMNQALLGYLEMMDLMRESGKIDKALIDDSIEVINRSSKMIDDVKKLTRLQAGKVPRKDVDVCKILSKVKARYSGVPSKPVINYTPGENCIVRAGDQLEDVFDNLVDNAIRHAKGPVTIDVGVDKVTVGGRLYYRVTVADTGPGIPDEMKCKIFKTSAEAMEKMQRRGFGLYLVRTLMDYYHGKVWAEDRIQGDHTKGARFVVTLPAVEK